MKRKITAQPVGSMSVREQKAPQPKIKKMEAKPMKPAGEGMGMRSPVGNLGHYAHPPKKMDGKAKMRKK